MPQNPTRDQEVLDSLLRLMMAEQNVSSLATMFEDFAAVTLMRDSDLSPDELQRAKTNGGNDGGLDFAFLLSNGVLLEEDSDIVQLTRDATLEIVMLSCTSSPSFRDTQVQKIHDTVNDLLNFKRETPALRRRYNQAVLRFFQRFRLSYTKGTPRRFQFRIIYAAHAPAAIGALLDRAHEIEQSVRDSFTASDVVFEFADAGDLYQAHQAPARFERDLVYAGQVIATAGAYVCLVRLTDFVEFVNRSGHLIPAMLEANVRDYQGNIEVNRGIRETLLSEGDTEFWWLNNGVTILTNNASIVGDRLHLERPQIVNGLQTTFEIFNYLKGQNRNEHRHLLVRIIQTADEPLRDRIIRATNSQTAIPTASLWATDELQRQIETYVLSHGYYYDRRKNYYHNQGKPRSKIITIPGLAQAITAMVLLRPDHARARPSTLLKTRSQYATVFDSRHQLDVYLKAIQIMEIVDGFLAARGDLTSADRNNFRFHVAAHVATRRGRYREPDVRAFSAIIVSDITEPRVARSFNAVRSAINEMVTPQVAADSVSKSRKLVERAIRGRTN